MREIPLRWMPGRYSVCKINEPSDNDLVAILSRPFVSVTRTDVEWSMVVPEGREPRDATCERGWFGCQVVGTLEFELVGILARLTAALANVNVPVFAISTHDTDYLFVKAEHAQLAHDALAGSLAVRVLNEPPDA